jgi:hypothetical protein
MWVSSRTLPTIRRGIASLAEIFLSLSARTYSVYLNTDRRHLRCCLACNIARVTDVSRVFMVCSRSRRERRSHICDVRVDSRSLCHELRRRVERFAEYSLFLKLRSPFSCKCSSKSSGTRLLNAHLLFIWTLLEGLRRRHTFLSFWGWSETGRPLFGLLYQPRMIDDDKYGAVGGMRIDKGNRSTRRKPAPVPLCSSQIPHDLTWDRTRAAAMGTSPQYAVMLNTGCCPKYIQYERRFDSWLNSRLHLVIWQIFLFVLCHSGPLWILTNRTRRRSQRYVATWSIYDQEEVFSSQHCSRILNEGFLWFYSVSPGEL